MRKHRLKSLLKISFCFSSVLGDACGRPVKGASWETVEPLDLSNTVLILTERKSKSALPVDVSVTEADISPFLMRTYNPDSLEPCALAWRHWPQSKERLPFFFFFNLQVFSLLNESYLNVLLLGIFSFLSFSDNQKFKKRLQQIKYTHT